VVGTGGLLVAPGVVEAYGVALVVGFVGVVPARVVGVPIAADVAGFDTGARLGAVAVADGGAADVRTEDGDAVGVAT
jgi:hypothetical protein